MRLGGLSFPLQFPAWCMLACGLIASFSLFTWEYRREQGDRHASFERRAQFRASEIEQGMTNAIDALQVVNQLFVTNGEVNREQFHSFTQPLRAHYPYIEAFAFHRLVSRAERPAFETRMRVRYPGFTINEMVDGTPAVAAAKDRYLVIDYVEPMTAGHEAAFGLDSSSLPFLGDVIRRADDTGRPSATGLSPLIMAGAQRGLRILMAVYRGGAAPDDVASRRLAVVGYTVEVLRTSDLIRKILATAGTVDNSGLNIRVYAAASADERELVYGPASAATGQSEPMQRAWLRGERPEAFSLSRSFDVAGTTWYMKISAQPKSFASVHAGALFVLFMGLLATFATTAYVRSAALRAQRIRQLVAQRTDELGQANDRLTEDIKVRKKVEEALRHSRSKLRRLAHYQNRVKEDERKRIARDIHDDLGQTLVALRIDVSMMAAHPNSVAVTNERINAALHQIDATIDAVRVIINDLRPATLELGLHAAVEWQAMEFERRSGIACELHIDHEEFALDDKRATALFRIVQESLTNIIRHAQASRVMIEMRRKDDRLLMTIADDGIGLSPDCRRKTNVFGLVGIEERIRTMGGVFSTASNPGEGMAITVSIPI